MNKKTLIILGVVVLVVVFMYSFFVGKYNTMVTLDEGVNTEWSNVEVQYQRRLDLIPNIVSTVKGYASHEKEVLLGITQARASAGSVKLDATNLTKENLEVFQKAQSGLSSALSRLLMVSERYPDLQANQNFMQLTAQLEGTENRIAVARRRFNEKAQGYNTYIRKFPTAILAGWFGFEKKEVFQSDSGAENAPKVSF